MSCLGSSRSAVPRRVNSPIRMWQRLSTVPRMVGLTSRRAALPPEVSADHGGCGGLHGYRMRRTRRSVSCHSSGGSRSCGLPPVYT